MSLPIKHLTQVASKIEKKPLFALCTFLVVMLALEMVYAREMSYTGQHTAIRRLDCSVFCRKTGFSGYVGGCQCGFTLFANKRSQNQLQHSRLFQAPTTKLIFPENNYLSDDESAEEVEMDRGSSPNKDRQASLGSR